MTGHIAPHPGSQPCKNIRTHVSCSMTGGSCVYTDARRFWSHGIPCGSGARKGVARARGRSARSGARRNLWRECECGGHASRQLLLDQGVLRGVGNIYADESLWRAKDSSCAPGRAPDAEAGRSTAPRAPDYSGKGNRDARVVDLRFLDAEGEPGEYQRRHRAYGREGKPCYRCRTLIRRTIVAGRSSYFCPRCQRALRGSAVTLPLPKRRIKRRKTADRSKRNKQRPLLS